MPRPGWKLLLPLLLAACSAESRLWRITPFARSGPPDPQRVNGWPLLYSDQGATALLWPLMDFDDRGFAVRPLVSKDGSEWDVLFPLSHFDTRTGEGWALTGYSSGRNAGLFPLFNLGERFSYAGPAWWMKEEGEVTRWGLFPIAYGNRSSGDAILLTGYSFGENVGLAPLFNFGPGLNFVGPAWWKGADHRQDAAFGLFPLFTWSPLRQVGPVWWRDPAPDGGAAFGLFPLVWATRGGSRFALPPFYYQDLAADHSLRVALLPPTWWEDEGAERSRFVFPFYAQVADAEGGFTAYPPFFARSARASGTHWFTPVANGWRREDASGLNVYPLYWSARSPDSSRHMLAPFYLYRERGSERLLLTPLGGRAWDASGATRFVNFLGPLYHHSIGSDTETTAVLWPLLERERTADATRTRAFPLFDVTRSPAGTDAWLLAGLARHVTDSGSTSFRFWPLYGQSDAEEPPDLLYDWSIASRRSHGEEWSNHLFPLYFARGDAEGSSMTTLLGLARVATTEQGAAWRLWPLASGSSDPDADGWIDRATLFRRERRGDVTRTRLFPLWASERRPDLARDDLLLSLVRRARSDEGSAWRLWPLASTTSADGLDDLVDSFTLVGVHPHPDKTHVHVGTSLLFGFDRRRGENPSWNARVLTFFNVGRQERSAPAGELEAATSFVRERSYAGFLFDWFLIDRRVVQAADGERRDESHWRLPLLHEYERRDDTREWDLLCWAVHSKETPAEERFSVLGYGYRSVRRGEETTRDIFPFITCDSGPDSSRFSFLWRLFRHERRGERRGGHVLFIPWGDLE